VGGRDRRSGGKSDAGGGEIDAMRGRGKEGQRQRQTQWGAIRGRDTDAVRRTKGHRQT
jgi:hypothetical protein